MGKPASREKLDEIRGAATASLKMLAQMTLEQKAEWRLERKKQKATAARARYHSKKERLQKEKEEAEEPVTQAAESDGPASPSTDE